MAALGNSPKSSPAPSFWTLLRNKTPHKPEKNPKGVQGCELARGTSTASLKVGFSVPCNSRASRERDSVDCSSVLPSPQTTKTPEGRYLNQVKPGKVPELRAGLRGGRGPSVKPDLVHSSTARMCRCKRPSWTRHEMEAQPGWVRGNPEIRFGEEESLPVGQPHGTCWKRITHP